MTPIWMTELPESLRGSPDPVFDAETKSVYACDGWGTAFASLSLRRLSLADGSVTGVVRVRTPVFSVSVGNSLEPLIVVTGTRIVELERATLGEVGRWDKGVPRYSHRGARLRRHAVLMSWLGPTASIFDLESGT